MKNMVRFRLSAQELDLVNDIIEVGFGELQEVRSFPPAPAMDADIPHEFAAFLRELRDHEYFDLVVIHEGRPKAAEVISMTSRGRKYKKKLRF